MFLKQSTAYTFRFGPFLDDGDGKTAETGLTIEDSHVRVSKAGANFIDKAETSNSAHDEAGFYVVVLNATDTNTVGELQIACHISGALPVFKTFYVLEEAIYDAMFAASADLITKVDAIDTVVDAILVDTGTTLDGKINTIDGIVDAILVDTAEIGSAGAGLTAVPWNSSWDAEVQSECADALTAHWGATLTESYASDGAAATPAQLLYMIYCCVGEFAIDGTTITGKKLDGSSTAMTWTISDASNPTSRTRAS